MTLACQKRLWLPPKSSMNFHICYDPLTKSRIFILYFKQKKRRKIEAECGYIPRMNLPNRFVLLFLFPLRFLVIGQRPSSAGFVVSIARVSVVMVRVVWRGRGWRWVRLVDAAPSSAGFGIRRRVIHAGRWRDLPELRRGCRVRRHSLQLRPLYLREGSNWKEWLWGGGGRGRGGGRGNEEVLTNLREWGEFRVRWGSFHRRTSKARYISTRFLRTSFIG